MNFIFFGYLLVTCGFFANAQIKFLDDNDGDLPRIQDIPNALSLSKDWAIKFDEELGRGDTVSESKRIELENNLIEVAEILHIIPVGTIRTTALPLVMMDSNTVRDSLKLKHEKKYHANRARNPKFRMYGEHMED